MKTYTIGRLAAAAGVPTSTVRYYEREGILTPDERTAGNYRQYGERAFERLRFVRSAQAVGLTLQDIVALMELCEEAEPPCGPAAQALMRRRLDEVKQRIRDLRRVERVLTDALNTCLQGEDAGLCATVHRLKRVGA